MNRVHVGARSRALENQCLVVVSQTVVTLDYSEAIDTNNGLAAFYAPLDLHFPEDGILANGAVLNFQKISQIPKKISLL